MSVETIIKESIKKHLKAEVLSISKLGNGCVGSVYKVECDTAPYILAMKVSGHSEVTKQEYRMLTFLREKTESKIPTVYWLDEGEGYAVIAMEYIDGVGGESEAVKSLCDKKKLAESIVDNLIVIHQLKGTKFGPYDNAEHDSWKEYYKGFADVIIEFARMKHSENELDDYVFEMAELSYARFDEIFTDEDFLPTMIHGDYWMPNFIIDPKSSELLSAVDPFNLMWADPEYELFALTVGYGEELGLYELYKSKVRVSEKCDIKTDFYYLYSELLWYKKLGSTDQSFLRMLADRLNRSMKRFDLI